MPLCIYSCPSSSSRMRPAGHGMLGEAAASRCCAAVLRSLRQSALRARTLAQLGPQGLDQLMQVLRSAHVCSAPMRPDRWPDGFGKHVPPFAEP